MMMLDTPSLEHIVEGFSTYLSVLLCSTICSGAQHLRYKMVVLWLSSHQALTSSRHFIVIGAEPRGDESSELPTAEVDGGESELALEPPSLLPPDADWVLTREEARLILGAQANLWTEYVPDEGAPVRLFLSPRVL